MWLGRNRKGPTDHLDIEKVNEPMRILGIFFTHDSVKRKELNFDEVINEIKMVLRSWKWRNPTLYGRVQILKTLILPKIYYRAALLCQDENIIKQVNLLIHEFLWKGKDKVKRGVIIDDYQYG